MCVFLLIFYLLGDLEDSLQTNGSSRCGRRRARVGGGEEFQKAVTGERELRGEKSLKAHVDYNPKHVYS